MKRIETIKLVCIPVGCVLRGGGVCFRGGVCFWGILLPRGVSASQAVCFLGGVYCWGCVFRIMH